MTRSLASLVTIVALVLGLAAAKAHADAASDRAVIADSLSKMAVVAHQLGKAAQGSDDRGVRKKFAPVANDIGDDLDALARRAGKPDVEISVIVKGMAPIEKDATQLVDLADEAEDKAERKKLRADASQLQATISAAKKLIETFWPCWPVWTSLLASSAGIGLTSMDSWLFARCAWWNQRPRALMSMRVRLPMAREVSPVTGVAKSLTSRRFCKRSGSSTSRSSTVRPVPTRRISTGTVPSVRSMITQAWPSSPRRKMMSRMAAASVRAAALPGLPAAVVPVR